MPPLARFPLFVAEGIKPLFVVWIIGRFERLPTTAGKCNQKLQQWIMADDALNGESFRVAGQSRCLDLKPAIDHRHFSSLTAVLKRARWFKCGLVEKRLHRTFGEAVMRNRPKLIFLFVTLPATGRAGVSLFCIGR